MIINIYKQIIFLALIFSLLSCTMNSNNNLKMFCLTLEPNHLSIIEQMNYIPVGLGEKNFPQNC